MTSSETHSVEPSPTKRLEEEGEIAADYLEELLDIADLDGDIEIDVENDRAAVEIVAEDPAALRHLAGADGEVLEALQELTRLAVQTRTG
ncbi:MAG TPA: single-stranded DNA-binding protein, partial [Luteimicrobium sp.]|nr:single-stranded DNA-binding protein [Luteimicrobium sp.]